MKHIFENDNTCPFCGAHFELATNTENNRPPKDGDVTMCANCTAFSIFDDKGKLRRPTREEDRELNGDPRIAVMIEAAMRAGLGRR